MPRSGTSLTASVLARKGYYVGSSRLTAFQHGDDHNPFGYFEADDVVERNVEIFRRVGFHYQNTWRFEMLSEAQARAIRELAPVQDDAALVAAYETRRPWLWKDQRLCFTLAYWWKLLPADTRVLVVKRSPVHIYESFIRMGWCTRSPEARQRVERLAEQHLGAAEEALRLLSIPFIEVDYGDYRTAPERVAERIGGFLGVALSSADLNVRPELDHSRPRGAIAARLRTLIKKLPRAPIRRLERIVPQRAVAWVFPERRYVRPVRHASGITSEQLAMHDASGAAEQELAAGLGTNPFEVALAARRIWGRSLSIELQHRLETHAVPGSRRDQILSELGRELSMSLERASRRRRA
ncbi:MAG TPA: sulfotransferase [Vicinamibacterales bacterium]|nr:sulfotransferase [Vicinamibacterales bacterium]